MRGAMPCRTLAWWEHFSNDSANIYRSYFHDLTTRLKCTKQVSEHDWNSMSLCVNIRQVITFWRPKGGVMWSDVTLMTLMRIYTKSNTAHQMLGASWSHQETGWVHSQHCHMYSTPLYLVKCRHSMPFPPYYGCACRAISSSRACPEQPTKLSKFNQNYQILMFFPLKTIRLQQVQEQVMLAKNKCKCK